jgi:SAM-dependent methyltransferase
MSFEDEQYFRGALENLRDAVKTRATIHDVLNGLPVSRVESVLDVGCGVGQALYPLAVGQGAVGVGIDVSVLGPRLARDFYTTHLPDARVTFIRGKGESLPFPAESFDVVNCGLALPYMHNATAFAEVARVLRSGGIYLLKIHHARYYTDMVRRGVASLDVLSIFHGTRVLVAGMLYHLTRRQLRLKFLEETFQTEWLLRRELARHGLVLDRAQSRTNPSTPAYVICKRSQ